MNRRNNLITLAAGAVATLGASGCAAIAPSADGPMVVDDGLTEITPAYIVTYTEGQPTAFVRANFFFYEAKKQVRLRSDGFIKVNGTLLKHDPETLTSYIGNLPVSETFAFEFTRKTGQVATHSFALPSLDVLELPRSYSGVDPIRASIRLGPEPPRLQYDRVNMTIFGRFGETRFKGERGSGSTVVFRSIQYSASPPNFYRADIYRQQYTALKDISETQRGWAVLSRGRNFEIEIVPE